jgi:hypothetical protein
MLTFGVLYLERLAKLISLARKRLWFPFMGALRAFLCPPSAL